VRARIHEVRGEERRLDEEMPYLPAVVREHANDLLEAGDVGSDPGRLVVDTHVVCDEEAERAEVVLLQQSLCRA
jgi:hypothetical protein